jgi:hypothetical protein
MLVAARAGDTARVRFATRVDGAVALEVPVWFIRRAIHERQDLDAQATT